MQTFCVLLTMKKQSSFACVSHFVAFVPPPLFLTLSNGLQHHRTAKKDQALPSVVNGCQFNVSRKNVKQPSY